MDFGDWLTASFFTAFHHPILRWSDFLLNNGPRWSLYASVLRALPPACPPASPPSAKPGVSSIQWLCFIFYFTYTMYSQTARREVQKHIDFTEGHYLAKKTLHRRNGWWKAVKKDAVSQSPKSAILRSGYSGFCWIPPCSAASFWSKLRAPHRGTSLGPLVCGANKIKIIQTTTRIHN